MVIMDMPRFEGKCPFVKPVTGCEVYSDRPATCRYYPIGQGTLITEPVEGEKAMEEFYFYVREPHCRGYEERGRMDRGLPGGKTRAWTITTK